MAVRSLNKVLLIGNLTRDPELRYTPHGTAVCTFGIATNRSWQPSDGGERQESAEFHRIVSWQKLAELCAQLLFKGRKVFVEGRLQTRTWSGKDGQERTTTEIVIDSMIVLDSRRRLGDEGDVVSDNLRQNNNVRAEEVKADEKSDVKTKEKAKVKKEADIEKKTPSPVKSTEVKEEVRADDIPF